MASETQSADIEVTGSSTDSAVNATVLVPDSTSLSHSTLTKDNSSFFRIGQYNEAEEGSRSPSDLETPASGVLVQTTGGLYFLIKEAAYQEFQNNLDILVSGDESKTIDGNSSLTITGNNAISTSGKTTNWSKGGLIISTGDSYKSESVSSNEIVLKSPSKVKLSGDTGVSMTVGDDYAKIDDNGHWKTHFAKQTQVTEGFAHSRFIGGQWTEYYGGKFALEASGALTVCGSIAIGIYPVFALNMYTAWVQLIVFKYAKCTFDLAQKKAAVVQSEINIVDEVASVRSNSSVNVQQIPVNVDDLDIDIHNGLTLHN